MQETVTIDGRRFTRTAIKRTRGANPPAPKVVAECWTCGRAQGPGTRLVVVKPYGAAFVLPRTENDVEICRAAGHDVREVRR